MRTAMITAALAVVATTGLVGISGAAQAAIPDTEPTSQPTSQPTSEPTTTNERGIVIECTGMFRGRDVWTSVYENDTVQNVAQVVIGDDGLGAIRETTKPFKVGRDVRATVRLDGTRAVVEGTAHAVGRRSAVHEEHDDAGQHLTIDGTHRRLDSDLALSWRGRTVALTCDNAFVYDLQVTREDTTD